MTAEPVPRRLPGAGWLALLGGGEFSFGETLDVDRVWLSKAGPGPVGFVPAASGSNEYGHHFVEYLDAEFDREGEILPIYRERDARRAKNLERIHEAAAVYLGGGVADHLLDAVRESPAEETLRGVLEREGGLVVAIAAAAQAAGAAVRSIFRGEAIPGLGWLPRGVVEANFDPAHDRRLRQAMETPGIQWGLGLPAGTALLLGPEGEVEVHGTVFVLDDTEADFRVLQG